MTHTLWQLLGIEPTKDRRIIRKAYALQLKKTSPEDDPRGFQSLRDAYQTALEWCESQPEPTSTTATAPQNEPSPAQHLQQDAVESVLYLFLRKYHQGNHEQALAYLKPWWQGVPEAVQKLFNREILTQTIAGKIPGHILHAIVWELYWSTGNFHFVVNVPQQQTQAFLHILKQTIEKPLWDIRHTFAAKHTNKGIDASIDYLQAQLASQAFDHLERRHMLRLMMLRFFAANPHLTGGDLVKLENVFHFSHFIERYHSSDLEHWQTFKKRMG